MKETGIIFTAESVRAILEDRKSQTRRTRGLEKINADPNLWHDPFFDPVTGYWNFWQVFTGDVLSAKCPYGQPGDLTWGKETWATEKEYDHLKPSEVLQIARIWYLADGSKPDWAGKTRSAMFMCRWMSRITDELTEVRAERLQEITPADCFGEGYQEPDEPYVENLNEKALAWYRQLWDSINAKKYPWESNDWVWVLSS